jgi:hypothetical protein
MKKVYFTNRFGGFLLASDVFIINWTLATDSLTLSFLVRDIAIGFASVCVCGSLRIEIDSAQSIFT